jgi:hypothetical protein
VNSVNRRMDDLRGDMNARFGAMDARFGAVDNRFSDTNKRLDDLRQDMNARFTDIRSDIHEIRAMLQEALRTRA